MGKAQSKYIFNPPKVDPMFRDIGCVGLKRDDYGGDDAGKLAAPPFLYYRFTAKTYRDLQLEIGKIFKSISPTTEAAEIEDTSFLNIDMAELPSLPTTEGFTSSDNIEHFASRRNPFTSLRGIVLKKKQSTQKAAAAALAIKAPIPTGNGNIYGPVYFLVAQDPSNKTFEGFLYFPSMTKNKQRYRNYIELGISHRWMNTLLYSRTFARTPVGLKAKSRENTKCETYNYTSSTTNRTTLQRIFGGGTITKIGDPLKYGCRTNTSSGDTNTARACMESEEILREQGTFKDGSGVDPATGMDRGTDVISSEKAYYPAAYFHTYQLDTSKPSFAPYMNSRGFDNLQLNIMVSGIDMFYGCDYMLISPNSRVMLNLNKNFLALFINSKSINPSRVVVQNTSRLNSQIEALMRKLGKNFNPRNIPPPPPKQQSVPSNPLTGPLAFADLSKQCYDKPKFTDGLLTLRKYNLKGTGMRYVIEGTSLNVYVVDDADVEDVGFTIEVVDPKTESQPPYAMLLDNTGRLRIYDNNDKEVTSPKLTQAFSYDGQPNPDGSDNDYAAGDIQNQLNGASDMDDMEHCYFGNEPYDSVKSYRCRLLNLIAYLQFRGLLKDLIGYQDSENPDENIQQFKIIYEKVATFNSTEDYVRRIIDLVNYIELHYHTTIDEGMINSYFNDKGISTLENIVEESQEDIRPTYNKVPQYNETLDTQQRTSQLKDYMKSYNILKDEPLYDDQALQEQSQQLPLTANLYHDSSQYNKDQDYQHRLMNLQSYYPLTGHEEDL
jgi:hypothetical protein